jgi:hypothetical protein
MNETVKAALAGLPREFILWLESLRHKNPLIGSNAGANANSVFVEIGKNLVVDAILDAREEAIHPKPKKAGMPDGSELITQQIVEN